LCSLVLTGCLKDTENAVQPVGPVSYVSIYDASPDAPALTIVVDNNQINARPFSYSDYTGYLPFYAGQRRIQFGPFGASNVAVDTTVTLVNNTSYSFFVVNEYSKASVLVLEDTTAAPATGKAKVRFLNLSPDAGDLQLGIKDGAAIAGSEGFKHASGFTDIDAKSDDLTVTGSAISPLSIPGVNFVAGHYYTILVQGYKTTPPGNEHVLSAQVIGN